MPGQMTLLYLYAETPLHAGVGRQTDAAVDLPIQRDPAGYPLVRASTLKGALRAYATTQRPAAEVAAVFGSPPEAAEADRFPGALVVGDAPTLLFPVRSLVGVFAWVTGPAALAHLRRSAADHGVPLPWPAVDGAAQGEARVTPDSRVRDPRGYLTLEDLTFQTRPDPALAALGRWLADLVFPTHPAFSFWREKVKLDLVLLSEDAFRFFVAHCTDVASRIRLDPRTGTAAEGALWTEEALPADTLLYAPLAINEPARPTPALSTAADALRWLRGLLTASLQVGGSRTLGRGFLQVRWADGAAQGRP